jgi:hypothetical protein
MMSVTSQRVPQTSMTLRRFRVRRWTEFTWASTAPDSMEFVRVARDVFERALQERYPELDGRVELDGQQLVFAMTIYAETSVEAQRRASYRFERALTSTVPIEGRPRRIVPPWGKMEARSLDG